MSATVRPLARPARLVLLHEIAPPKPSNDLVRGLLGAGELVAIIGPSGSGKSNLATHLAVSVGSGARFFNRDVAPGPVVYFAAEAPRSTLNRLLAYRCRDCELVDRVPFLGVATESLDLADVESVARATAVLAELAADAGTSVKLVIIDTFARCFGGDNENDAGQMNRAIAALDRIRAASGAAVVVVHHTGKNSERGARGSSAFGAAVDTEITVQPGPPGGPITAVVTKQRDRIAGQRLTFQLDPVRIALDPEGLEDVTATVVVEDMTDEPQQPQEARGKHPRALLEALRAWSAENPKAQHISSIDLQEIVRTAVPDRQRRREAIDALVRRSYLQPAVGGYRLHLSGVHPDAGRTYPDG